MDRLFGHPPGEIVDSSEAGRPQRWVEAFETWLERREREQGVKVRRRAELAWEELLSFAQKKPWEITTNAVQAWVAAQVREGRSASTIQGRLTAISNFYQTIHESNELNEYIDHDIGELENCENEERVADLGRGIGDALDNPVISVQRPQPAPRKGDTSTLSARQVVHLLHAVRGDRSSLGKRDCALISLVLSSAQQLDPLRKLKVGAVEIDGENRWVRWERGKKIRKERINKAATTALADHLDQLHIDHKPIAGTIFSPTEKVYGDGEVVWDGGQPLTRQQVLRIVQQYSDWVGMEAELVAWQTLRNTAVLMRLEKGETLEEIHALLGKAEISKTRAYLKKLREKPRAIPWREGYPRDSELVPYQRSRAGAQPVRGLYAKHLLTDYLTKEEIESIPPELREVVRLRLVEGRVTELFDEVAEDPDQGQALSRALKLLGIGGTAVSQVGRRLLEQRRVEAEVVNEWMNPEE